MDLMFEAATRRPGSDHSAIQRGSYPFQPVEGSGGRDGTANASCGIEVKFLAARSRGRRKLRPCAAGVVVEYNLGAPAKVTERQNPNKSARPRVSVDAKQLTVGTCAVKSRKCRRGRRAEAAV